MKIIMFELQKILKKTPALFAFAALFFCFVPLFGAVNAADANECKQSSDKFAPKIVCLTNPITGNPDVQTILGRVVNTAMGALGALALMVFVYGGFRWLTAAGNDEHIKTGTQAMMWAVIGIFIIFGSYAMIKLVYTGLGIEVEKNNSATEPVLPDAKVKEQEGCYCVMADASNEGASITALVTDPQVDTPGLCNAISGEEKGMLTGTKIEITNCKWKKAVQ